MWAQARPQGAASAIACTFPLLPPPPFAAMKLLSNELLAVAPVAVPRRERALMCVSNERTDCER